MDKNDDDRMRTRRLQLIDEEKAATRGPYHKGHRHRLQQPNSSRFFGGSGSEEAPHEQLPQDIDNGKAAQLHVACPQHQLGHNQEQN